MKSNILNAAILSIFTIVILSIFIQSVSATSTINATNSTDPLFICALGQAPTSAPAVNSIFYANVNNTGIGNWNYTTSYPQKLNGDSCATSNGYIYCIGGQYNSQDSNFTAYAQVTSTGVGTWHNTTPYPLRIEQPACTIYNGYIYCISGQNVGIDTLSNYYAPISSNGIGAWVSTTPYPAGKDGDGVQGSACEIYNDYIYCVGGNVESGPDTTNTFYAAITNPGIGGWNKTNGPNYIGGITIGEAECPIYNGYINCPSGGYKFYYASVSSNGVGIWTQQTLSSNTPAAIAGAYSPVCDSSGSTIYCITNGTSFIGTLSSTGGLSGLWQKETVLPQKLVEFSCKIANPISVPVPPLSISISPLSANIDLGQSVTFTNTTVNGTSPYTYTYTISPSPGVIQSGNKFIFNSNGTFDVTLNVSDSAGKSATSTAVINVNNTLTMGSPSVTVSNQSITIGQFTVITANVLGGTKPYSFVWTWNGNILGSSTNTLIFYGNTSTLGTNNVIVQVTDSAGESTNAIASIVVNNVPVAPGPSVVLTSSGTITVGATETLTAQLSNGVGPFTVNFVYFNNATVANTVTNVPVNGIATYNFTPEVGTFTFNAIVTDMGTSNTFNSTAVSVVVNAQSSGGSPGGGSGGSGGGGGGGNFVPTVTQIGSCYEITNFSQDNSEGITLDSHLFTVTENFISPTSAGISVDGTAYTLNLNQTVQVAQINGNNVSLTLKQILLVPLDDHTVTVDLCSSSSNTANVTIPVSTFVSVNLTVSNNTIKVTSTKNNDTVELIVNGNVITTGKGNVTYNGNNLPGGNYTLTGKDITAGVSTSPKLFEKPFLFPSLDFINECVTRQYNSSTSCTTVAQIISPGGELIGTLYLNGAEVGTTNSIINDTESKVGTYNYLFSTPGNANYSAASIQYSYNITNSTATLAKNTTNTLLGPSLLAILLAIAISVAYFGFGRRRKKNTTKQ